MFLEIKNSYYGNNEVNPIEIYKYLPKLDCKKCGYQNCLSFSTMLAKGKVNINRCENLEKEANRYNLEKVKSYVKNVLRG